MPLPQFNGHKAASSTGISRQRIRNDECKSDLTPTTRRTSQVQPYRQTTNSVKQENSWRTCLLTRSPAIQTKTAALMRYRTAVEFVQFPMCFSLQKGLNLFILFKIIAVYLLFRVHIVTYQTG
jgi:hypothetical protein